MDAERDLLFGVVALQKGAVDADRLAETCAVWVTAPTVPLADLMVDRGLMTDEKRIELEKEVALELEAHGGDPHVTLAAALDTPTREAIGKIAFPGGHVVVETLSPAEESRNRYTRTHLHAKGGMGQVWLARDRTLDRLIALKELRPDQADNSAVCSRFLHEAKITAQLEHPGIVPVYELGDGEAPYYTMRFVKGRTLNDAIRDYHKQRAAGTANSVGKIELLTAFVGICHAVHYAHSRGIIHRDLKGQNVALGDFGEVVVLDWGLASASAPTWNRRVPHVRRRARICAAPTLLDPGFVITVCNNSEPDRGADTVATDPGDADAAPTSNTAIDADRNSTLDENSPTIPQHPSQAATDSGASRTIQGHLLGTPGYMAPEQAMGRHDLARPAYRRLRLGGHPLRDLDWPAAVCRAKCTGNHHQSLPRAPHAAAPAPSSDRAGLGSDLPEGTFQEPLGPLSDGGRHGPGSSALAGRRTGPDLLRALDGPRLAVGTPASNPCRRGHRSLRDCDDRPGDELCADLDRTERGRDPGTAGTPGCDAAHQSRRHRL